MNRKNPNGLTKVEYFFESGSISSVRNAPELSTVEKDLLPANLCKFVSIEAKVQAYFAVNLLTILA